MKVLFVAEAYAPRIGGGVKYMVDIIKHFRSKGHRVDVLTVNSERRWKVEFEESKSHSGHGNIYRAPRQLVFEGAWLSSGVLSFLWRKSPDYDVVHFNFPNPIGELAYRFARLRRSAGTLTVCFYHADIISAKRFHNVYNHFITKKHLQFVNRIIVSNPRLPETSPILKEYRSKIQVIPFGVDLRRYSINSTSVKEVKGDSQSLKLLFVGRLVGLKGLDYLIKAMKFLPCHLKIVGSGPLESQYVQLRSTLGLEGAVDFLGSLPPDGDELLNLYTDADVLVLPSYRAESFGYVLIEAMAMNTAVISTELGTGTSWVNQDGSTGFVIPPRDVESLVTAIRRLDEDRLLLASFKQLARDRVEDNFSLNVMLDRTESLYRELGLPV